VRGNYGGVTLRPPVIPLKVEAEADLAELADLGFTRATVEIRYNQFGDQVAGKRGLVLSPAAGEPLDSLMIFRDRDDPSWQYRVNLYHKKIRPQKGRWTPGSDDGYVYCVIPEKLRAEAREAMADSGS
jgi:hypothetical protein